MNETPSPSANPDMNPPSSQYVIEFAGGEIIVRSLFSNYLSAWSALKGEPDSSGIPELATPGFILVALPDKDTGLLIAQAIRTANDIPPSEWSAEDWKRAWAAFLKEMNRFLEVPIIRIPPAPLQELN